MIRGEEMRTGIGTGRAYGPLLRTYEMTGTGTGTGTGIEKILGTGGGLPLATGIEDMRTGTGLEGMGGDKLCSSLGISDVLM
jgi:hypothetical protein